MFGNYDEKEIEINRSDSKQQGKPYNEKYIEHGEANYGKYKQKWICVLCNKEGSKYNWRQNVSHYISKHSNKLRKDQDCKTPKGEEMAE